MFARLILCALLVGAFGVANAQQKTAAPQQQAATHQLTPEQRAAIQKRNQELVAYSGQILKMIDNGQIGQVWDGMSEVGKKVVTRSQFEQKVGDQRKSLGAVKSRRVAAIYANESKGDKTLPAGTYMNVRYLTQFASSSTPKIELVSFHLDSDKKIRLSGYAISDLPKQSAAPAAKR